MPYQRLRYPLLNIKEGRGKMKHWDLFIFAVSTVLVSLMVFSGWVFGVELNFDRLFAAYISWAFIMFIFIVVLRPE